MSIRRCVGHVVVPTGKVLPLGWHTDHADQAAIVSRADHKGHVAPAALASIGAQDHVGRANDRRLLVVGDRLTVKMQTIRVAREHRLLCWSPYGGADREGRCHWAGRSLRRPSRSYQSAPNYKGHIAPAALAGISRQMRVGRADNRRLLTIGYRHSEGANNFAALAVSCGVGDDGDAQRERCCPLAGALVTLTEPQLSVAPTAKSHCSWCTGRHQPPEPCWSGRHYEWFLAVGYSHSEGANMVWLP